MADLVVREQAERVLARAKCLCSADIETRLFTKDDLPELSLFAKVPRRRLYPLEIFGRLLLAFHVPDRIRRILYLDTDTRPLRDPAPLFEVAMGKHCVAAAASLERWGKRPQNGVLVIDVERVRRDYTPERLAGISLFMSENSEQRQFQDEAVVHSMGWSLLPPKWNVRALVHGDTAVSAIKRARTWHTPEEIIEAICDPAILHPFRQRLYYM